MSRCLARACSPSTRPARGRSPIYTPRRRHSRPHLTRQQHAEQPEGLRGRPAARQRPVCWPPQPHCRAGRQRAAGRGAAQPVRGWPAGRSLGANGGGCAPRATPQGTPNDRGHHLPGGGGVRGASGLPAWRRSSRRAARAALLASPLRCSAVRCPRSAAPCRTLQPRPAAATAAGERPAVRSGAATEPAAVTPARTRRPTAACRPLLTAAPPPPRSPPPQHLNPLWGTIDSEAKFFGVLDKLAESGKCPPQLVAGFKGECMLCVATREVSIVCLCACCRRPSLCLARRHGCSCVRTGACRRRG